MIAAYIKSRDGLKGSCDVQESFIRRFCRGEKINDFKIYRDEEHSERTTISARKMREIYGIKKSYKQEVQYEEWDRLYSDILNDRIKVIIVDFIYRLYTNIYQYDALINLCAEKNAKIVELCNRELHIERNMKKKVVVYHYSNTEKKPTECEKTIDRIYELIDESTDQELAAIYIDYTSNKSERKAYIDLREHAYRYDILMTVDFHHIQRKIGPFIEEVRELNTLGIKIKSLIDGEISSIADENLFEQKNRVAAFHSTKKNNEYISVELQKDIMKTFVELSTAWEFKDCYIDDITALIEHKDDYDMLLVPALNKINWRTAANIKILKQLKLPIYSLKEGYINANFI